MLESNRYLKTSDYKRSILLSHLDQLIQSDEDTLFDAELDAISCIESMLTDEYEIESEFELGKSISDINYEKEYFKDSYVIIDGRLSKANSYANPSRPPKAQDYWRQMDASEIPSDYIATQYNPDTGHYVGEIVSYDNGLFFECMISNGVTAEYGGDSIVSPIPVRWEEAFDGTNSTIFDIDKKYYVGDIVDKDGNLYECVVDSSENGLNIYPDTEFWQSIQKTGWSSGVDYSTYDAFTDIIAESGLDYSLIEPSNAVVGESPSDSILANKGAWKQINVQTYQRDERYERPHTFDGYIQDEDGEFYYVSEQDEKFINSAVESDGFLFSPTKDPRNRNIIKILVELALYQLHSVAVPDNIPTVRISNYEKSMEGLDKFSKMKANPNIPRKVFTYTVTDRTTGCSVEKTDSSSRWVVNDSDVTSSSWDY